MNLKSLSPSLVSLVIVPPGTAFGGGVIATGNQGSTGVDISLLTGVAKVITTISPQVTAGQKTQIILQDSVDGVTWANTSSTGSIINGVFTSSSGTIFDAAGAARPLQTFESILDTQAAGRFLRGVVTVFGGGTQSVSVTLVGLPHQI